MRGAAIGVTKNKMDKEGMNMSMTSILNKRE